MEEQMSEALVKVKSVLSDVKMSVQSVSKKYRIKCILGCDHKIKTEMVCENKMHNRTHGGDKIHNPLSHFPLLENFGYSVKENNIC